MSTIENLNSTVFLILSFITDWLFDWLTDWQTDRLTDWLTDWLIDWLTDRLIDWLTQTDWLIDRLRLTSWLTCCLTNWRTCIIDWRLMTNYLIKKLLTLFGNCSPQERNWYLGRITELFKKFFHKLLCAVFSFLFLKCYKKNLDHICRELQLFTGERQIERLANNLPDLWLTGKFKSMLPIDVF